MLVRGEYNVPCRETNKCQGPEVRKNMKYLGILKTFMRLECIAHKGEVLGNDPQNKLFIINCP